MAEIKASSDEKVFRIQEFFGLNENADGDTKLKLGEASVMRNFKITRDKSLQKRPGQHSAIAILSGYSVGVEAEESVVREDRNASSTLTLYANATAQSGNIEVSGEYVQVQYNNWQNYVGYYWPGPDDNIYQFSRCEIGLDGKDTIYTWYMKGTYLIPPSGVDTTVSGIWRGSVSGESVVVAAAGNKVYKIWSEKSGFSRSEIGTLTSDSSLALGTITFFGFAGSLYILTGESFFSWDGAGIIKKIGDDTLDAYIPLVAVSIPPGESGGGSSLQQANILTKRIRVWLSPNGTETGFVLPGTVPARTDFKVTNLATGATIPSSEYDIFWGSSSGGGAIGIEFESPPAEGENSIEVEYSGVPDYGGAFDVGKLLHGMKYVEMYNGSTDTRVFLYGNGTNKVYYSDLDTNGVPRADYFPALNVINVGAENTSVTGLIRHYSRLIAFKEDETYSIQYGTITLPDNTATAAFYCTPVNKRIGNSALGQVRLVLNSPYTLFGNDVYEWRNNSSYSSNLTIDERQARRVSDRVYSTLSTFDLSKCYCYDDNDHQEYYICYDKKALVYNYAADAWYYYTNFDVMCMVNVAGELYAGDSLGRLNHISRDHRTDNGAEITGYWASGSEPFDREFYRKYSAMLWVVLKPELRSRIHVTVETDRKSDHSKKVAASSVFSFRSADFRRWSFNTNRKPHTTRLKIKAKKFTYYKLILEYSGTNTTATVVAADMRIRYTGYAK